MFGLLTLYTGDSLLYTFMKKILIILALLIGTGLLSKAQPAVGRKVPDIVLPSLDGTSISLSSLKGKVVLIDFWASWCGPCRYNNRDLKEVYNKYHDKGFEIFAISLDENKGAWKHAVLQDEVKWLQVIDAKSVRGNGVTRDWQIQYIPTSFLIDKVGKLVEVSPRIHELERSLKKLL